jgi:type I restriction enzyme S subunit
MSFPRYDHYQDSDIELLGEVPTHWDVWKLAHAFTQIGSGTTPKSDKAEYYDEGTIPWVNTGDLDDGPLTECAKNITEKAAEDHSTLKLYPAGSLLFAMYGATIGKLGMLEFPATVNQACCVFSGDSPITAKFLFYWFLGLRQKILSLATGGGQPNVSQDILRTLRVACPDKDEQKAISSFLDSETSKIDGLVAEQRRLIELLKEKRQAVISHAVTKGLNPNAPMKDSGIEWLGDVPEHWEVEMLSRLTTKIGNGFVGPTRDILVESGVPYVQATHIKKGRVNFDGAYFVTPEWAEWQSKAALQLDDVLVVQTGAGTGDVGLVSEEEVGYRCHALIIVRSIKSRLLGSFLSVTLQSQYGVQTLESIQTGGMHPHLNCGNVKFVYVPIPPLDEQQVIVEYIAERSQKFDSLEAEAKRAIELLQERRTALITAAVTGKIDVREFASKEDTL